MARKSGSRAEITGPRLRDAALLLFARHGYAAVSMRQIAAEIGVQAGALYLYIDDKQSLLFDLMHSHMQELFQAWQDSLSSVDQGGAGANTAMARLEHFARFHIRFHAARQDAVFIAYMELRNLTPENFARIEALRRRYETELESILRAGQAEGSMALPDTKLAALAIIAMLNGVNTWFREGGRLSRDMVEDIHIDMIRKAVAP
ncbi:TetR/AcrR family transcriptional regulator [Pararhodobacter sp.]|jgi:AcrR family transcriptional regulator|uniref:TetR/AcrR family transcriptional regulator n=1 Tax=Pararhodobacter sp. TaxID=2127056 RepID=UPI002FDCB3C7